ncbi:MAG: DNA mismatch repair protein MutS, partial [Chlamydiae bacterium]|nr:DNA mismatch repair protein MutS [Chlamydiota bacterium]
MEKNSKALMEAKITPMMQQWHDCKAKAKEALLLFRLGDFYEAFYQDAKLLADTLHLTLTQRGDVPMSGIPAHTVEGYLEKLLKKGHLVAIAEQVEDPKDAKGLVKREIVRLLSPGAVYQPTLLDDKTHNFFASIYQLNALWSLALIDITTASFKTLDIDSLHELEEELYRMQPKELLLSDKFAKQYPQWIQKLQSSSIRITVKPEWYFETQHAYTFLAEHFQVHNLDGFGLKGRLAAVSASAALLQHIQLDLSLSVETLQSIETLHLGQCMLIDQITQKHLDIFSTDPGKMTLHSLLDHTTTPMGSRLFKEWIQYPLLSPEAITARLDATEELITSSLLTPLQTSLKEIRDLERLMLRIHTGHAHPRDLIALKLSLKPLPSLFHSLQQLHHPLFLEIGYHFSDLSALVEAIDKTLVDDPPLKIQDGFLIKEKINPELDDLKRLKANSEEFLLQYQENLKASTGIKTLKVGFNKAFGYFIELSRGQSAKVPPEFHKRQTLVNTERFITEELRDYENKILHAEETISKLEQKLYLELKAFVASFFAAVMQVAKGIAHLDSLLSLATLAKKKSYTKPKLDRSSLLEIKEGRHPLLEETLPASTFIPNDIYMKGETEQLFVITGPNMAGKSTYLRQVALICIMAQIGCFVPAASAHLGVLDKVFSRIGASDDLSRGQSTFMVEMTETANILHHATPSSLIILDEIGRGTSTYDGISIAWAVAQYLLTHPEKRAKTLFATHYCELIELE